MNAIIYHSRDLDGLASGASLVRANRSVENMKTFGFHYGEEFDIRHLSRKNVGMVDVSFDMKKMFSTAKISNDFIWIDHHVSAYEDFLKYAKDNDFTFKVTDLGLIKQYSNRKLGFTYYYSPRLSACEICAKLFIESENYKQAISLLGQYDTWRNNIKKKFVFDKDWDKEVIPFQYGMRMYGGIERVGEVLDNIADWRDGVSIESISESGKTILAYQKKINLENMKHSFDITFRVPVLNGETFEIVGDNVLKGIAFNGGPFNSKTFEGKYFEDVYDFMMPFAFQGKTWNVSLYTTNDNRDNDIDILSIAKSFGGGGHKQACGFQLPSDQLRFLESGEIQLGKLLNDRDELQLPENDFNKNKDGGKK